MAQEHTPRVVNAHHFGGSEKLPSNTKYIGRPSPFGNAYSSKSGKYTREQCVALHRIDLYQMLTTDPTKLTWLKSELEGYDLACWCKQPKRVISCHGDNYLHLFSDKVKDRDYSRSVIFYLMEDLRSILSNFDTWINKDADQKDFLALYIHFGDIRVEIQNVVRLCREWETAFDPLAFLIGQLIIDLELAFQETSTAMVEYHFFHISWIIDRFVRGEELAISEPVRPDLPLKRKSKDNKHESE